MATQEQKTSKERADTNQQQGTKMQRRSERTENQSMERRGFGLRDQMDPYHFANTPFGFMRRFSEEMDRLFEDFGFGSRWLTPSFGGELSGFGQGLWSPNVETFEREGQLVIRADLPGLSKDDVDVEITDDAITISGERRNENEEKREGYFRSERSYGSFYRQIPLPEGVDANDANATFRNGVLEITMKAPKLESRGRKLEITEGGAEPERSRAQASGK